MTYVIWRTSTSLSAATADFAASILAHAAQPDSASRVLCSTLDRLIGCRGRLRGFDLPQQC